MIQTQNPVPILTDEIIPVGIDNLLRRCGLDQHLGIIPVLVHYVVGGDTALSLTDSDTVVIVGIGGGDATLCDLRQTVAGIITICDSVTVQGFAEGVAVVVVGIDDAALLQQPVVIVVGIGRVDAVYSFAGTVARCVVLIACAVVAVDRVGDSLTSEAVEVVVDVVSDSAAVFGDAAPSTGGIKAIAVALDQIIKGIGVAQFGKLVAFIVTVIAPGAVGVVDGFPVAHRIVGIIGGEVAVVVGG